MSTRNQLESLYRYFAWADYMQGLFKKSLSKGKESPETFVTMSYWYGGLYVVIEGWEQLKLADQTIDTLLSNAKYKGLLKRYRNATFHYQGDYWHTKFKELWQEAEPAEKWIIDLHDAFHEYLDRWYKEASKRK